MSETCQLSKVEHQYLRSHITTFVSNDETEDSVATSMAPNQMLFFLLLPVSEVQGSNSALNLSP